MNRNAIERAVALTNTQLRKSNQALRKNLKRVIECSSENEKIQEKMDVFEACVFEAESLKELSDSLITQGRRIFEVKFVTVSLDERYAHLYPEDYKKQGKNVFLESQNVVFAPSEEIASHFASSPKVELRGKLKRGNEFLFPADSARKIRSEALIPLCGSDSGILGALCFGSPVAARFMEGYGTRFLDRLGRLVSLKMEVLDNKVSASHT